MKVVYHRLVQRDLDDTWNYYEEASPGLGDAFLDEFLAVIRGIQQHPQRWALASKG